MRLIKPALALAIASILASCSATDSNPRSKLLDEAGADRLTIHRLDTIVYGINQLDNSDISGLIEDMDSGVKLYFRLNNINVDSVDVIEELKALSETKAVKVFGSDAKQKFPTLSDQEIDISLLAHNLNEQLPKAKISEIYSVISPYRQGIIVDGSTILIALNLYMGADYAGNDGFDNYFKSVRTASRIDDEVAEAMISINYPFSTSKQATLLNNMLYNGAIVYSILKLQPETTLAEALGVSQENLNWFEANEAKLWESLLAKELLYSADLMIATKLIAPSPISSPIASNVPGRAARYLGYKIVKSYVENHPGVTLETILSPGFYDNNQTLIEAKYAPKG